MRIVTYGHDLELGDVFRQYPQTVVASLEREYKVPLTVAVLALLAATEDKPVVVDNCEFWTERQS